MEFQILGLGIEFCKKNKKKLAKIDKDFIFLGESQLTMLQKLTKCEVKVLEEFICHSTLRKINYGKI